MEKVLDLHIHSSRSHDGRMEVRTIIEEAKKKGLSGVAICDHDVPFFAEDCPDIPEDFIVINGIEFSTELGHVLGLFIRKNDDKPESGSFIKAVNYIHSNGGIAVLAHPFEKNTNESITKKTLGQIDGIECWNGRANRKYPDANKRAELFASSHSLPSFAGSDAHVAREIGNGRVYIDCEENDLERIKEKLLLTGNRISGSNGRATDVARSQFTRLKRKKKGIVSYLKWSAFALKCVVKDIFSKGE